MKIILATHNNDKFAELTAILNDFPILLLSLNDFPEITEIVENGNSLKENALIKARTVHGITQLPTLADDTGLEVDALNGKPGIFSARYAGTECSYSENIEKLLQNMKHLLPDKRTACFRTNAAFVDNNMELVAEGLVEGMITLEPKGVGGFGYDPVFYVLEKNKTYAEMTMTEKNHVSHRYKAIYNMINLLHTYIPNTFNKWEDIT